MTNAITYPAAYNVLSCEEMTYTEGGVGVVEAAMAWFPLYGWYKAVSAIHDYRKANINSNLSLIHILILFSIITLL